MTFSDAAQHLLSIPHASTTVDHELVRREVRWEIASFHCRELKLAANVLLQPPGNLHPSDILFNRVVRARLSYEHLVPGLQRVYGHGGSGLCDKVALQA